MNIIITGASSGIGYSTSKAFARVPGNRVFAISRNREKLKQLAQSEKEGVIIPVEMDISTYKFQSIVKAVGNENVNHIDILIHNAGLLINKPFHELESGDWESIYRTNVIGPALLTRELIDVMGGKQHTHIVTIGSMGGVNGTSKFAGLSAYSSSKGALATFTECLAVELQGKNITSNCLALGSVQTEMLKKAFPEYHAKLTPEEISDYIYDFSVNGWRYFNGKILEVSSTNP